MKIHLDQSNVLYKSTEIFFLGFQKSFLNKILKTPCVLRSHGNVLYEKKDKRNSCTPSQRAPVLSPGASSFPSEAKAQGKGKLRAELKEAMSQYFIFIYTCLRI